MVLTGEVRGEIEACGCPTLPYGGFNRREKLLATLDHHGPLFQLDAGELLLKGRSTDKRDDRLARARLLLDLSGAVGVDAWAPGPSDLLALGVEGIRALAGQTPVAINATWSDSAGPLLPPSTVLERDGLRLGVIGLGAAPAVGKLGDQVQMRDPVLAAREALAALPADLDLVVALGSVSDQEALRVAAEVPGLAAVLSTRGEQYDDPRAPQKGGTPVIETPDRGRYVQVLHLRLGTEPGGALQLMPTAQDWRDLAGLRARQTEGGARLARLESQFEATGTGRNLAATWSIPLGTELDGPGRLDPLLEGWRDDARALAAANAAQPPPPTEHGYASAGACVGCHTSEFARWSFSPHSRAWESLKLRKKTDDPECVACHVTGWGEPGGMGSLDETDIRKFKGVQCEACHGPVRGHPKDATVEARAITPESCLGCHDEANSPSFDFASYLKRATCQGGAPSTVPPEASISTSE